MIIHERRLDGIQRDSWGPQKIGDRERGTGFPSIKPYLYIPWQQTEGSSVVVLNPRPISVPNNLHEKTTMISEQTEVESRHEKTFL